MTAGLVQIPVGIVVARRKATNPWADFTWHPTSILVGEPVTAPWTVLFSDEDSTTYYAGSTKIELFRTETANYRDNLARDRSLWVVLQPADRDPPYDLLTVTADPAEGEAYTEAGDNIVEKLPMPDDVSDIVAAFIAEHHVEQQPFVKRQRTRDDGETLPRRRLDQNKPGPGTS